MTRYTADAVAMSRYLVDSLPKRADGIFERAEHGLDVLEAPTVIISEAVWTSTRKGTIAGLEVETTATAVLRGLVQEGPIQIAPTSESDLAVFGSLIDHHSLHDALLIANHRVRETEAIVSTDEAFDGENTVWK